MNKVLIAIDDSPNAMKAVEYVARQFAETKDVQIGIVHVLPNLPAIFWDEGHILSVEEKKERQNVVDKWLTSRKARIEPMFKNAVEKLTGKGISAHQIQTKSISDSTDVADSILEEAKDSGYQTIVLGRHNGTQGKGKRFFMGTIANKIITQGSGMAITIVE